MNEKTEVFDEYLANRGPYEILPQVGSKILNPPLPLQLLEING